MRAVCREAAGRRTGARRASPCRRKAQTGPGPRPGVRTRALPPAGRSASRSRHVRPTRGRSGSGRALVLRALPGEEARGRPHPIPQGEGRQTQVRRQVGGGQAQGRPHRQQTAPEGPARLGGMYRLRTPSARRGRRNLRALPHRQARSGARALRCLAVRRLVREMLPPDERRRLAMCTVFGARIRGPFRRTEERGGPPAVLEPENGRALHGLQCAGPGSGEVRSARSQILREVRSCPRHAILSAELCGVPARDRRMRWPRFVGQLGGLVKMYSG